MEIKMTRTCARCARVYTPTGMSQKYCPKCGDIVKNEQIKKGGEKYRSKVKMLLAEYNSWNIK